MNLTDMDKQMLLHLLSELDGFYSYSSCNDPSFPADWTIEQQEEYTKLVSAADPDKQAEYYEPDEPVDVWDSTLVSYIMDKIKET